MFLLQDAVGRLGPFVPLIPQHLPGNLPADGAPLAVADHGLTPIAALVGGIVADRAAQLHQGNIHLLDRYWCPQ